MARCLDYRHGLQDSAVNRRNELLDNCHRRRWIKLLQVDAQTGSTHYYFRVSAVNDAGVSAYVSADCASNSDGDSESGSLTANDDDSTAAIDFGMDWTLRKVVQPGLRQQQWEFDDFRAHRQLQAHPT